MQTDFFLINFLLEYSCFRDFPGGSDSKASVYDEGDPGLIPGSGRSPGEGNSNPLQYFCLENPMNRGAWRAIVHGVTKDSDTTDQLSTLESNFWIFY